MRQTAFLALLFAISILFSCTEPTLIGSELLEEDQANFQFTNEIPVDIKTVGGTPVPTYNPFITFQLGAYLFGQLEDPVFGKSSAGIYTQVTKGIDAPDLDGLFAVDSIVLSLAYDSLGAYGDLTQPIDVEVYRLEESLANTADYLSDRTFATDPTPIGSASFIPAFADSVSVASYLSDSVVTTLERPHVRIPLKLELGEEFLSDTAIYASDTTFVNFFKGIYIKPVNTSGGMVSFSFNSGISRITLYYRSVQRENIKFEYRFPFTVGNARNSHLVHETTGSAIEEAMGQSSAELAYMQGMAGANVEVSFPNLSGFDNVVVNKAELELTVAADAEAGNYPVAEQIVAATSNQGVKIMLDDVLAAILSSNPIDTDVFGGIPDTTLVNGQLMTTYKINISSYFQDLLNGEAANNVLLSAGSEINSFYLPIIPKAMRANRVIFYGANHPEFAPKLNLIYTNL